MGNVFDLRNKFLNPPIQFRSAPFWAWNDRLEGEEFKNQIKDMKIHGMGGAFIHSREGLETEYLSEEWMECVRKSINTAKESEMDIWIYDEDKWPSGAVGGMIAARDREKYAAKALTMEMTKECICWDHSVAAVYMAEIESNSILNLIRIRNIDEFELKGDNENLLVFRCEVSGTSEWYNNSSPSDNLNPEAVALFIEMTHEKYKKEFYDEFGKTIKGMFTDEPNVADFFSKYTKGRPWLPWTHGFEGYFKQKRGYEIMDVIPFLFFEGDKASKARHDFWRTVSERFSESYSKQIGAWCEQNSLIFTGHFLFENDMGYATRASGSTMPQYRCRTAL